jgi:hypothetical protein
MTGKVAAASRATSLRTSGPRRTPFRRWRNGFDLFVFASLPTAVVRARGYRLEPGAGLGQTGRRGNDPFTQAVQRPAVPARVCVRLSAGVIGVDLVVLVGLQASGKSTFCRQRLVASHTVVSKDAFGNARHRQRRQMLLVTEALAAGRSVVVDNTNPSPAEWQPLIEAGREHGASVVGYWFPPDPPPQRPATQYAMSAAGYPRLGSTPPWPGCAGPAFPTDSTSCSASALTALADFSSSR